MGVEQAGTIAASLGFETSGGVEEDGVMYAILRGSPGGRLTYRSLLMEIRFEDEKVVDLRCEEVFTGP